jgi:hypothetical protein
MPDDKRPIRFLHLSDVFLDARLSFHGLKMSAAKRGQRNQEALEALLRMLDVARLRQVDAVVITGNLWEGQSVTAATAAQLAEAFAQLSEMPVLITPGIADPLNAQSFYDQKMLSAHGLRPWSANVHIFNGDHFTMWQHPANNVRFYGRANIGLPADRLSKSPLETSREHVNILLDYQPFEQHADHTLLNRFTFAAYGGSFHGRIHCDEHNNIVAATPGSLVGRSVQELGLRSSLFVELDYASRPANVRLEQVPADHRQLVSVSVSINGINPETVPEYVAKVVESSGARSGVDIVHVKLTGFYPPNQRPDFGENQLKNLYFHAKVENATRPDYLLDKTDKSTTTGRFIHTLQELKNKAESRGGILTGTEYGATLSTKEIEDALYLGLDALNCKKVTVPDVD